MTLTVRDRAQSVATFRFLAVRLMETVAGWTPTTPEMEVKVLFGKHIWDLAQHADALGHRTFELRSKMHWSLAPRDEYLAFLDELRGVRETTARLSALYDVALPALAARLERYETAADPILDGPTVVITARIRRDVERMTAEATLLRGQLSLPGSPEAEAWRAREASFDDIRAEVVA
jgi:hypothetical protein